jgi:hypothetical protein
VFLSEKEYAEDSMPTYLRATAGGADAGPAAPNAGCILDLERAVDAACGVIDLLENSLGHQRGNPANVQASRIVCGIMAIACDAQARLVECEQAVAAELQRLKKFQSQAGRL